MQAPTIDELLRHPTVHRALEDAWQDSEPDDPTSRHEEEGWIYANASSGELSVVRAEPGQQSIIDLSEPVVVKGAYVVARFHTHPNPGEEGWYTGPSNADTDGAWHFSVPCLIRADDGVHSTGPDTRIGGLSGPSGYPLGSEEVDE